MTPEIVCPTCGNSPVTCQRDGHLELLKCNQCGWELLSTVMSSEELRLADKCESVKARIRWLGDRPTTGEIVAARKAIPALASEPLPRLLEECRHSAEYDLGLYIKSEAIELQERAKQYGLVVLLGAPLECQDMHSE